MQTPLKVVLMMSDGFEPFVHVFETHGRLDMRQSGHVRFKCSSILYSAIVFVFYQKPMVAFQELVVLAWLSSIQPLHLNKFQEGVRSSASPPIKPEWDLNIEGLHGMLKDIVFVAERLWSTFSCIPDEKIQVNRRFWSGSEILF